MQERIEEFGGSGPPVVFAHANGWPLGSYRVFFSHLLEHCRIIGYHQRPMWSREPAPERLDWRQLTTDLLDTVQATQSEPVWMMGHSMGAVVSLLAAARRPALFRGLLLIDPVLALRRHFLVRRLMPARMRDRMPIIAKTLTRPDRFASRQEAFDFHRPKRAFRVMSEEVVWDYVNAGTRRTESGDYVLSYGRDWEVAAYRGVLSVWSAMSRVKLPVLGLRGETSDTISPAAFARWARVQPHADLRECRGGHLLPLERPAETAAEVVSFLR